jgi:cell division protein FtsB
MQAHDLDIPNLDAVHELDGRSRLFLEDDPPISVEDGPPTSVEYDASTPSVTKWASSASAVFLFLFLVLAGVGGALAWRLTGMNKPTAPPEGIAELQQQLKSIAADLSAVRHTLEQQSAANHDQLTRIQEQISQQSIALLSASPLADKPVHTPQPKPAQHPAHVSTQDLSKPVQRAAPQSLLPPKQ